ncbi:HAD family hydrolase [Clostridium sp. AN503]|uniref:HAD family hydrolase n=1 Tax=Clostridium sp. AN503 TaxID=3160598 RepID=UPI00345B10AD
MAKNKFITDFIRILDNGSIKIVAFDYFDTIVHRDCNPELILCEWAKYCACYLKYQISPSELYIARKQVERDEKQKSGKEELPYGLLIKKTLEKLCLNVDFLSFLDISIQAEISIECSHISLDENIMSVFKEVLKHNKRIIIISDFYSDKIIVEKLCAFLDIEQYISDIFISSEIGLRKSTGNLYEYICSNLKISPDELLMVGDNKKSDFEIPKKMGIYSVWKQCDRYIPQMLDTKELKKKYFKLAFSNPVWSPLSGYVPEILYFISKLYLELIALDIPKVFFFSREGQLIKMLFDIYQSSLNGKKIETEYLYISRKSILLPSLNDIEIETFQSIFRQFQHLTVSDFLNNLSFSNDEAAEIYSECGIGTNEILSEKTRNVILGKLKKCERFITLYDTKRNEQKKIFLDYLRSFGTVADSQNTITIVDIGWKGTIQDCLQKVVNGKYQIRGYYLGIVGKRFGIDNIHEKCGILFTDTPKKSLNYDLFSRSYMFYERIFVADHGPVLRYEYNHENIAEAVIDNIEEELNLYNYMREYQQRLIDCFKKMLKLYDNTMWLPYEQYGILVDCLLRKQCIHFPKVWKVEKIAREKTRENFGEVSRNEKKERERIGAEQLKKVDFYFVDYAYRLPEIYNLQFLKPLSAMYCRIVYWIKKIQYTINSLYKDDMQ